MELTNEEKQAILDQRLKQFAVEKYSHEVNKDLLVKRKTEAKEEAKADLDVEIAKADATIAEIQKVIDDTQSIAAALPVEAPVKAPVQAEVVDPVAK